MKLLQIINEQSKQYIYGVGIINGKRKIYKVDKQRAIEMLTAAKDKKDDMRALVDIQDMPSFAGKPLILRMAWFSDRMLDNIKKEEPINIDGDDYELQIVFDEKSANKLAKSFKPSERGRGTGLRQ